MKARMLRAWPVRCLLLLFMLALTTGCGIGQPSVGAAEEFLRSRIDSGKEGRLRLTTFKKTDGQASEGFGSQIYEIMFDAEAEFVSDAMFTIGGLLMNEGREITTSEYRAPSQGFSWNDFFYDSQGHRRAKKGDSLRLTGRVAFVKRESGWVADGVSFEFAHDAASKSATP